MTTPPVHDELEAHLATYEGFQQRVEPAPGFWRNAGAGIGVLGILVCVGTLVQGNPRAALYLLAGSAVLATVLIVLGVRTERRTLRPLHAAYLARGWLAAPVPTGLVLDPGGDDASVELAGARGRGRSTTAPAIVLVGLPRQPPEVLEAAAATVREQLTGLPFMDEVRATERIRSQLPPWGAGDAAQVFAVPEGTLLTERAGGAPFLVVIPPAHGSRKRPTRFYPVRGPLSARSARRRRRAAAAAR